MANRRMAGVGAVLFCAAAWSCTSHPARADDTTGPKSVDGYTKPADSVLKTKLNPLQYDVTQKCETEPPFKNEYWNNHLPGIYVDVTTGQPLFSSTDKYDSGTGWPSFTKPIDPKAITTKPDGSGFGQRTEVRSSAGDAHLGHVFDDGPGPSGLRYCMNSASLRFVPVDKMDDEGYGKFLPLFGKTATKKALPKTEMATVSGGCFWGMQEIIRHIPGVITSEVGYTGGNASNPSYEDVHSGSTGHAEAVQVTFDPSKLSFAAFLGFFFRMHDPTTLNRQGNDVGSSYRSAIFFHSEEQRKTAERVKAEVDKSGKWKNPVVTEITAAGPFYPAEDYHQDYLQKNPGGYTCHFLRD